MSKFKKGDKVKVVASGRCNHNFPIGSTAEVLGEMMFGVFNCVGESDSGYELFQTVEASDIEHIKEEVKPKGGVILNGTYMVKDASRCYFKEGEIVVWFKTDSDGDELFVNTDGLIQVLKTKDYIKISDSTAFEIDAEQLDAEVDFVGIMKELFGKIF